MKIVIVFKNGHTVEMKCDSCDIKSSDLTGNITGIKCERVKDNQLLYVDFNEILCIYRKLNC
jgi:hypothetical protein